MKLRNKIYRLLAFSIVFLVISIGVVSAQQRQQLTPGDYSLWEKSSSINGGEVSQDGKWIYYSIKTETVDSAFVRNNNTGRVYHIAVAAGSHNYQPLFEQGISSFSSNSRWFAIQDADTVRVLNLKSGQWKNFKGSKFDFIAQTNHLLIIQDDSLSSLISIHDLKTGDVVRYAGITSHQVNTDGSRIVIASEAEGAAEVRVVDLKSKISSRVIVSATQSFFNAFKWNKTGDVIAFIQRPKQAKSNIATHKIYICNVREEKVATHSFTPADSINIDNQKRGAISRLYLSDDGKHLFFDVRETKYSDEITQANDKAPKPVQIWGAAALTLPPDEQNYNAVVWYVWQADGPFEGLTNEQYPFAFLSGDQKNVMLYHKRGYLPQYKYVNSYADIFLKDRRTNKTKLLLEKVKDQPYEFMASPTGRYIGYFKKNSWWVYDFAKDTHTCITENMNIDWSSDKSTSTGTLPPYGSPGWLKNDQFMVVFDKYDIWLISPDGRDRQRITNGEKDNTTYRIIEDRLPPQGPGGGNQWFASRSYDGERGLFITSLNYNLIENGWWWWTTRNGLSKIITKQKKIDYLSKPAIGKPLVYTEQDFDLSPRLVLRHPSGKEEILYQTNPQQQNYYWGRSEVIRYKTIDGKDLTGALFFPANYDSSKKYPMVVEIYETRAKEAHYYVEPSESKDKSNYTINPTVYTTQGYFVLLPDISYRLNEPGISATRCVTAAVQAALDKGSIDKTKMGLTGYSFGGYETTFIITQTDMFAAVIAGGGITDLPDFYLGISSFGTNFTRVEEDQFRMNVPFYSEAFSRNSPMHNIDKIKTPILLYTGEGDTNVDWTQSRRFQTAMWRLGKPSAMLVYPGENHGLVGETTQLDLSKRMLDWFNYYLKGQEPAQWIKDNMGSHSVQSQTMDVKPGQTDAK
jgi:dipeptidyl aminopeptidase/acylaminoacyl peptidase